MDERRRPPDSVTLGNPKEVPPAAGSLGDALEALRALRQQVEDTVGVAQTDSDGEWITEYHFKTGAIHRLLALARDPAVDAGLVYRTGNAPLAAPSASALTGKEGLEAPTREAPEPLYLALDGLESTLRGLGVSAVNGDYNAEKMCERLIEEANKLCNLLDAYDAASEQPRAAPVKDPADSGTLEGLKEPGAAAPRSPDGERGICEICLCPLGQREDYLPDEAVEYRDRAFCWIQYRGGHHGTRASPEAPSASDLVSAALPSGARQQEEQTAQRAPDGASPSETAEAKAQRGRDMRADDKHSFRYDCPICADRHGLVAELLAELRAAYARGRKERDAEWREALERALGIEADIGNHTPEWAEWLVRRIREIGNAPTAPPASSASVSREGTKERK